MAQIRPYQESYFARRRKIYTIISLALLAVAATAAAAWYLHSRGGPDPYAGKVVRLGGSIEDVGLVKNYRAGKSITYYSAGSGFHELVDHRFSGAYTIEVLAGDAAAYLEKMKRAAEAGRRNGGSQAEAPAGEPPPVEVVPGAEENDEPAPGAAADETPAAPAAAAAAGEEDAPGYAGTREQGIRDYDDEVSALAAKADRIDALWQKHRDFCQGTIAVTVGNAYGREWFGIYSTINAADTPECKMMIQEMQELSADIDAGMEAAWEKAHRAGVYPGQIRAVQQKYFMELDRWNK
jgi:hypothetical protein